MTSMTSLTSAFVKVDILLIPIFREQIYKIVRNCFLGRAIKQQLAH